MIKELGISSLTPCEQGGAAHLPRKKYSCLIPTKQIIKVLKLHFSVSNQAEVNECLPQPQIHLDAGLFLPPVGRMSLEMAHPSLGRLIKFFLFGKNANWEITDTGEAVLVEDSQ